MTGRPTTVYRCRFAELRGDPIQRCALPPATSTTIGLGRGAKVMLEYLEKEGKARYVDVLHALLPPEEDLTDEPAADPDLDYLGWDAGK